MASFTKRGKTWLYNISETKKVYKNKMNKSQAAKIVVDLKGMGFKGSYRTVCNLRKQGPNKIHEMYYER